MKDVLLRFWPHILTAAAIAAALLASAHAVMYKRDSRAAVGWVVFIWFAPVVGPLAYLLLGVNRIRRRATALRPASALMPGRRAGPVLALAGMADRLHPDDRHLRRLGELVDQVVRLPLLSGNSVDVFDTGPKAYEAMIAAIDGARDSLALQTYIFDNDPTGQRFAESLAGAVRRGVEVRVIVDAVGSRYSWPPMVRTLERMGIPAALFLPTRVPWRMPYMNLRSHRKVLVADGRVAFTGGMNIRHGHELQDASPRAIRDVHFRLRGPVVGQLREVFAEDWAFCRGEKLRGARWHPPLVERGAVLARAIAEGPDADLGKLRWVLLGALGCADRSVRIMTPYFVPDQVLITALNTAARRGVAVDIVLPGRNNLRMVQWASTATLWQVLEGACRVWLSRPPFDHGKIMVVDDVWSLIGSANWDARSLRLNFELDVECYDRGLAAALAAVVDARIAGGRQVTFAEVDGRSVPTRLRDGVARLFSPYL